MQRDKNNNQLQFVHLFFIILRSFFFFNSQGDSERTLCEDLSDNGGFKESLSAYRTLVSKIKPEPLLPQFENFTHEQLFTLAFANVIVTIIIHSFHSKIFKQA